MKSKDLLSVFEKGTDSEKNSLAGAYKDRAKMMSHKDDYVAVNTHSGTCLKPVFNNLVLVSDIRAYEIQQYDYKDRFSVFSSINSEFSEVDFVNLELERFFSEYDNYGTLYDKLKLFCNFEFSDDKVYEIALGQIDESLKSYLLSLGRDRIKALGYNQTRIDRELGIKMFNVSDLGNHIRSIFKPGDRYTLSNIKEKLRELYDRIGYKATPKANDILKYFEIKSVVTYEKGINGERKQIRGYEILNYKS